MKCAEIEKWQNINAAGIYKKVKEIARKNALRENA